MPILKWLLKNWLGVITAIVTGYNLIELRKTKRRRLKVTITRGDKDDGPVEKQGKNLLFINLINTGYVPVTVKKPCFLMPKDNTFDSQGLVSDVEFPHEVLACQSCSAWIREGDVIQFFTKACGLKGEVQFKGVVQDVAGSVWKSKTWRLDKEMAAERKKYARHYGVKI
jgi:hypothetical protein